MSTRSSARNLFPPLDNPELTIRKRSRADPTLLNKFEMATEVNGDPPVPDLRTMEELCQPSLNGRVGPTAPIAIQATNFGLKNDMIQQSIKVNRVTDNALSLYLFPHSLTHHATAWFDRLPRNSINTFEQMAKMFLEKYFPPSMVTKLRNEITNFHTFYNGLTLRHRDTINAAAGGTIMKRHPEECYDLIENMTAHHNDWDTSAQRTTLAKPRTYMLQEPIKVIPTNLKANDVILKNMQTNMTSLTNSNLELKNMFGQFMKMSTASTLGSGTLPGNTITNPKEDLNGITTRSGTAYQGPTIPTTSSSFPQVVERKTEVTKDTMPPTNNRSTKYVQPHVFQVENPIPNSDPLLLPLLSQLLLPFADAVILMPKFSPTIKTLLTNKDKLYELARTPLNKHCSMVLLKKFPEKLEDLGKFLIPCGFSGMDECLALADLGASINLMPLSVWNKLSLPELSPTCMTLELADRSISCPVGVAEDVFVKVGTFHFAADFVVVDFDADPREYSQEALGFFDEITSGNPTPYYDPIVSTSSPTLTPFGDSDFLLEEVDAFLALEDDPTSPKVDHSYFDPEGGILLLESFLNDDPSLPPPNQGNYLS
uniref:Retrotransposon gag domain-containing protein n=1 Tax=Tanacetum cinerariifolium TaxID=118510 RepID=A0A699I339_TANCI|nr:hypothetical protein [Tanacetum cinerariifolium]